MCFIFFFTYHNTPQRRKIHVSISKYTERADRGEIFARRAAHHAWLGGRRPVMKDGECGGAVECCFGRWEGNFFVRGPRRPVAAAAVDLKVCWI